MVPSEIDTQDPLPASIATMGPYVEDAFPGEQTLLPEGVDEQAAGLDEALASNQVGRFALLRRIGNGSMGAIYAAYDDVLDRKVAIKLVLPHIAASEHARDRMLREAQALARLRHTNVVQVYDAGVEGDRLFIAMEFVQGTTLRQWERERDGTRPWREVLDVYVQAGRGLAAAHAAGLVHRDFKPDNAMLGDDGVVRVMDFGLARDGSGALCSETRVEPIFEGEDEDEDENEDLDATQFDRSARAGTPAYMAPEQWSGEVVDARADQFSFCVALFEALWGRRPFEADSLPALAAAVIEGRLHEQPPSGGVPERIRRALRRGLRSEPDQRWPSMDALLAELTDQHRSRRTGWLAGGLGLTVIATAAGLMTGVGSGASDPCVGVDQAVAVAWSPERRQAIREGLEGIDAGYSADTAARLDVLLDDYAQALTAGRREACEATVVRHEQSEDIMLQRMRCLDRRQQAFSAQLEVLQTPDAQILEGALDLARELPSTSQCDDLAYVTADVPPPDDPQVAAEVEQIREQMARVEALLSTGKLSLVLPIAEPLIAQAEASGYEPVVIESLNTLSIVHRRLGNYETALRLAREAYVRLGDASELTAIETHLQMGESLTRLGRYEDAMVELRRALAQDRRLGTRARDVTGRVHNEMALLHGRQGHTEDALAEHGRALEVWKVLGGEKNRQVATAYNNIGTNLLDQGRYEEGLATLKKALAIRIEVLGPDHPRVGITYSNLAAGLQNMGRDEDAAQSYRTALSNLRAAYGDQHVSVGRVRDNLGTALRDLGRLDEALFEHQQAHEVYSRNPSVDPHYVIDNHQFTGVTLRRMGRTDAALDQYREALTLANKIFEPDHFKLAVLRDNIGVVLVAQGKYAQAIEKYRAARAIRLRSLDPEHPSMTASHVHIGEALHRLDRHDEALAEVEQALTKQHALGERGRPLLGKTHELLARIHLKLDDAEQAVEHAEQALEFHISSIRDSTTLASTRFTLARALWQAGTDRRRARGLATQSATLLRGVGASQAERLAAVERWLDEHPLTPM